MKHHIDTSIILEDPHTDNGRFCTRYLNKVKFTGGGVFSLPVLGELMMALLESKDYNKRMDFQEFLVHLIKFHEVQYYAPKRATSILDKIRMLDSRLDPIDTEILACAIEDGAQCLVTLDRKLICNKVLENEFNIAISHPKDLV